MIWRLRFRRREAAIANYAAPQQLVDTSLTHRFLPKRIGRILVS